MFDPGHIWRVSEHVRFRRLFEEGVLIHQESASAIVLNDTGIAFLEHCDGVRTTGDIINELCEIYDVERDVLASDIESYIHELAGRGIIREAGEAQ